VLNSSDPENKSFHSAPYQLIYYDSPASSRMASLSTWTELVLFSLLFAIVTFSSIPETSGVSYPLQRQGLLPVGKKVGDSLHPSIKSKSKRKKSRRVPSTKKLYTDNRDRLKLPNSDDDVPMYKSELKGNEILPSPPSSSSNYEDSSKIVPYYDCPLFENDNHGDGAAIIKADPYDCGCCYYCNWGIHYVQCCSWPLLWNNKIKSCDWYWKVTCLTYDGWDDK